MKLQPDLETVMPPNENSWRMLMEFREKGCDYRISVFLMRYVGSTIYWKVEGELGCGGSDPRDWEISDEVHPVPKGKWFLFELYLKQKAGNEGRVLMRVDGDTIAYHKGNTMKDDNIQYWHFIKTYTGHNSLDHGPVYQWVDDIEIYDSLQPYTAGIRSDQTQEHNLLIYPNPTSGVFSMTIKNITTNVRLEIFNMLGGRIYSRQLNYEKTAIDLSKQAKGIYFYQIQSEKRILKTGKIIIE